MVFAPLRCPNLFRFPFACLWAAPSACFAHLLELGVSQTVTALSRAVSSVLTSNAGKEQRLPGSSAYSRGHTHGKGDCRKCGFGGRGRTTIPAAAACSFSAFSRSYLSPKRYTPADGQTVNLGIIFGLFSPCALRLGTGGIAVWVSPFGAFWRFWGGMFAPEKRANAA